MSIRQSASQGDWKLWSKLSAALFVLSWLLPLIGLKDQFVPPIILLYDSLTDRFLRRVLDSDGFGYFVRMLVWFALASSLISILLGWAFYRGVLAFRARRNHRF